MPLYSSTVFLFVVIECLSEHCPGIDTLDLSHCSRLTDAALLSLSLSSSRGSDSGLRILCLAACDVTDDGVSGLVNALVPTLQTVVISLCDKLTPRVYTLIRDSSARVLEI